MAKKIGMAAIIAAAAAMAAKKWRAKSGGEERKRISGMAGANDNQWHGMAAIMAAIWRKALENIAMALWRRKYRRNQPAGENMKASMASHPAAKRRNPRHGCHHGENQHVAASENGKMASAGESMAAAWLTSKRKAALSWSHQQLGASAK
jgi:hypothetical protein